MHNKYIKIQYIHSLKFTQISAISVLAKVVNLTELPLSSDSKLGLALSCIQPPIPATTAAKQLAIVDLSISCRSILLIFSESSYWSSFSSSQARLVLISEEIKSALLN
ncbi:hypothetical protein FGO68_gene13047 [Halteria grandinella]|uniref:Uncharacterized protein n=1 Tax=Halteria grandinella TaxID=5974 RepID=A0A8J8NQP6_HALGN|nr:hypothetical protein FGO68_gene13047 [Halteria grandinella]